MSTVAPQQTHYRRRRGWQFSLGTGLALFAMSAVAIALLTADLRPSWYEVRLKADIEKRGGHVKTGTHGPDWAQRHVPHEQLQRIETVEFVGQTFTDADLELVADLENLRAIALHDTSITLAAAERLVDRRPELRITTALADQLYAHALESSGTNNVPLATVLLEFQRALDWKLAIAPGKSGTSAQQKAYEQHCEKLAELQSILKPLARTNSDPQLLDCAIAQSKMALSRHLGDRDAELTAGEQALQVANTLPSQAWNDYQKRTLVNNITPISLVLPMRIAGNVRRRVAELRGQRDEELEAHKDAIKLYRVIARDMSGRRADGMKLGAVATLLSMEQAQLAIRQGSSSPDVWKPALRRAVLWHHGQRTIGKGGLLEHAVESSYPYDVWFELLFLDAKAQSDDQRLDTAVQDIEYFARERARYLHALYSYSMNSPGGEAAWNYVACRMLLARVHRVGPTFLESTQHAADELLLDPSLELRIPQHDPQPYGLSLQLELAEDLKESSP